MPSIADDIRAELEEDGLSLEIVAASLRRVFTLVATGKEPEEEEPGPGWDAVALRAGVMFKDSEESDLSLTVPQFAGMLRLAFARTMDPDFEGEPFEALSPATRVAWETAARHAANLFSMDQQEARRVGQHEDRIADIGRSRLASPAAA